MRRGVLLVLICAIALFATAPSADAAATRAEYATQVNGICDSYNPEGKQLNRQFKKRWARAKKRIARRDLKGEKATRVVAKEFAWIFGRTMRLLGRMMAEVALVAPAPGDEAVIAAWIQGRAESVKLSEVGVRSMNRGKFERGFFAILAALLILGEADALVQDFGLTSCVAPAQGASRSRPGRLRRWRAPATPRTAARSPSRPGRRSGARG